MDQTILNNTNLLFGVYLQPLAEVQEGEKEVPKVEGEFIIKLVPDDIFRCKRCKAYINSKFEISYNRQNKRVAVCNLCKLENELDSNKGTVKSEYFNSDTSSVPELVSPTVDFLAPNSMKHSLDFFPHYIFMIDITTVSNDIGLSSYVS